MSTFSSLVGASKLIGVAASGILAGFQFASSFNSIPAIMLADLPADKLLKAWNGIYTTGTPYAMALIIGSSSAFYLAAYGEYTDPIRGHRDNDALRLLVAGTCALGIGAYTRILMVPGNIKRLQDRLALVEKREVVPSGDLVAVTSDVWQWSTTNKFRVVLGGVAFGLGLSTL